MTELINYFQELFHGIVLGRVLGAIFYIIFLLLLGKIITKISERIIDIFMKGSNFKYLEQPHTTRVLTFGPLLKNFVKYIVWTLIAIAIVPIFKVKSEPILAVLGFLSLALGFGIRNLIMDIINGFFIVFEDYFRIGEYVYINGLEGVVQEISMKSTQLRSHTNELIIVPNGEIKNIINYSRGDYVVYHHVTIDDAVPLLEAEKRLEDALLRVNVEGMLSDVRNLGLQALEQEGMTFLVKSRIMPEKRFTLSREINREVKLEFQHKTRVALQEMKMESSKEQTQET